MQKLSNISKFFFPIIKSNLNLLVREFATLPDTTILPKISNSNSNRITKNIHDPKIYRYFGKPTITKNTKSKN
jgi:hypothetical protein